MPIGSLLLFGLLLLFVAFAVARINPPSVPPPVGEEVLVEEGEPRTMCRGAVLFG